MFRWLLRFLAYIPYRLIFWIQVKNKKELKKYRGKPFVLAMNHRNGLDGPSVYIVINRRLSYWIKEEFFQVKFWRWFWRAVGGIPVKEGADLGLIRNSQAALDKNRVLVIAPQGHRSFNTDAGLEIRSGAAMIALRAGVPIIPALTDRGIAPFRLTKIKIGTAIQTTDYLMDGKATKDGIAKVSAVIKERMEDALVNFEKKPRLKKWQKAPNIIARGIVIRDNKLLAIKRVKDGEEYFVFPGGHIEDGETAKDAAVRETLEETGVTVTAFRELYKYRFNDKWQTFFVCEYKGGEPHPTDAEEYTDTSRTSGTYEPMWLPMEDLRNMRVKPNCVKKRLLRNYKKKGARLSYPLRLVKGKR
jgi:mutator protein MutT